MKLLIFDVDGVLEKEERVARARLNNLVKLIADKFKISRREAEKRFFDRKKKIGKEPSSVRVLTSFGFTRNDFFRAIDVDKANPAGLIEPHKHCREMLQKVSKGNKIVTLSNTSKRATVATLKILKIEKYIDKAYSSEQFDESKPSLKILRRILNDMRFKARDAVYIGNSYEKDIRPAHKLGMKTILFNSEKKYKKAADVPEADFVIKDLIEIVKLV